MRKYSAILLGLMVVAVVSAFGAQTSAERGRRRGGQGAKTQEVAPPASPQISQDMGEIQWGWTHKQLVSHVGKKVQEIYRPLLGKAGGAVEEDRIRREMDARLKRIADSYTEFNGQKTGWDVSLVREQYTHNNNEALLEVRELRQDGGASRYTDYFFFINDHLWRRYRAFNQDQFAGMAFDEASDVFQNRYGKGRPVTSANRATGQAELVGLEWQDDVTSLKAIDNTDFYGVFCLIFTERATERNIDSLRTNKAVAQETGHPLVNALEDTGTDDPNANIVEHLTGKRYKTSQPQPGVSGSSTTKTAPQKGGSATIFDEPAPPPTKSTGDVLDNLDI